MPDEAPSPVLPQSTLCFENIAISHCQVLAALHLTSFDRPWSAVEFGQMLGHPGTHGFIALAERYTPLGFILARSVVDEAEILTMCVDPQHRGQKIAARLLAFIMTAYIGSGIDKIFLEVAQDNLAAIDLYQKCGFNAVGERPGYYRKQGKKAKKAIIMSYLI
jgi:ribosomal-protein-alanine N-acetyltransferase